MAEAQLIESQNHALSRLGASLSNLFVGTGLAKNVLDSDGPKSPPTTEDKQKKHIETLEKARVDQDQTMAAISPKWSTIGLRQKSLRSDLSWR